jgi:hypothetical protein
LSNLSSSDSSEGINQFELHFLGRHLVNIFAALLDHFGNSCFQLAPSFGQTNDIFVEQIPLLGVEAKLHNSFQDTSSGDGISTLQEKK